MLKLLLTRHGESEGNAGGIVQGRLEYGLTDVGIRQAQAVAEALLGSSVDTLVTSPLLRARQTAEIIGALIGHVPIADADLAEYDVGAVSGLTGTEIRERYPDVTAAWQRGVRPVFPDEEGRDVFHHRVRRALARLSEGDHTVVVVAHGGVVAAMCQYVTGVDQARRSVFEVRNCALTEITRDGTGRLVLVRHNDVCHLADIDGVTSG